MQLDWLVQRDGHRLAELLLELGLGLAGGLAGGLAAGEVRAGLGVRSATAVPAAGRVSTSPQMASKATMSRLSTA